MFINHFHNWCIENGLRISSMKCFVLHIGKNNPRYPYTINNSNIEKVSEYIRDLGLFITPTINWNYHVKVKSNHAFKRWLNLFKFFRTSNYRVYVRLYKTYVRPILEFASFAFNHYSVSLTQKIESVQRRITRMIIRRCFPNKYSVPPPYHDRLAILDLHTLQYRRDLNEIVFFHKIHTNRISIAAKNVPKKAPTITRGHPIKYLLQPFRTKLRRNYFLVRTPKAYNHIPFSHTTLEPTEFRKNLLQTYKCSFPF